MDFFIRSKYRYVKSFILHVENISHKLAGLFPPLLPPLTLSHLSFDNWPEVGEIIRGDKEIIEFMQSTAEYSDLKRHKLVSF
jgi:hypothetical protein